MHEDQKIDVVRPRVLIIEDDDEVRDFLVEYLADVFDVESRRDAISGAVAAHEFGPDAILLDLEMPGFGGWDVVNVLSEDPRTNGIPVVILTALDEPQHAKRAREAGIAYLSKPIDSDLVIERLLAVVGHRQG